MRVPNGPLLSSDVAYELSSCMVQGTRHENDPSNPYPRWLSNSRGSSRI